MDEQQKPKTVKKISPQSLHAQLQQDSSAMILDVRTPDEYQKVHIVGAKLYPITHFSPESFVKEIKTLGYEGKPIYIACAMGPRSDLACKILQDYNITEVYSLEGGTIAWEKQGLPVVHGKQAMLQEQHVHITVGIIIIISILLGLLVSAWFYLIPIIIGFALIFASIYLHYLISRCLKVISWRNNK